MNTTKCEICGQECQKVCTFEGIHLCKACFDIEVKKKSDQKLRDDVESILAEKIKKRLEKKLRKHFIKVRHILERELGYDFRFTTWLSDMVEISFGYDELIKVQYKDRFIGHAVKANIKRINEFIK